MVYVIGGGSVVELFCRTVVLSSVRHLPCNNRVRFNRCKYGTEGYFSAISIHRAVFRPPWRNYQARIAGWWGWTFWITNYQRILVTEHRFSLVECFALFAAYSPPFSDSTWRQFVHVTKQYKILQKYLKF